MTETKQKRKPRKYTDEFKQQPHTGTGRTLKAAYGSALAIDEPLEYTRLALEGNLQMWVDAEDSLELW